MDLESNLSHPSRAATSFIIGLVASVALVVALGNPLREGVVIGIGVGVGLIIADLYTHYDLSGKRS